MTLIKSIVLWVLPTAGDTCFCDFFYSFAEVVNRQTYERGNYLNEVTDCKFYVVDSVMGSGKTSSAINYINSLPNSVHFIYVAPYLSEVARIIEACWGKNVSQPFYEEGRKLNGLYSLLEEGKNIVTTHQLFSALGDREIETIKSLGYICFIDETLDCVNSYDGEDGLNSYDTAGLLKAYVDVDEETGFIKWRNDKYRGVFTPQKELADNNELVYYNDNVLIRIFPLKVLTCFREVYILTYLFNGSFMSCYFKYFGLTYTNLYITGDNPSNFTFTGNKEKENKVRKNYRDLIRIVYNDKLNSIGDENYSLSYSWYSRESNNEDIEKMKSNLHNYFQNIAKAKSFKCLWAAFKQSKDKLSGKGYAKGYIAVNTRASNNYADRDVVAYVVNRFVNTNIMQFFKQRGIETDEDQFALSEMIQCIWRSAIRNDEPITLYIPSKRMRGLLENWIEENSCSN